MPNETTRGFSVTEVTPWLDDPRVTEICPGRTDIDYRAIVVRLTVARPAADGAGKVTVARDVHFTPAELLNVIKTRKRLDGS